MCVFRDGMPLMTVNSWKANQMDLVGLFMDRKERDKLELAKKRSPAHDFQRQIKFDPKQCPALKKESECPKFLIFT